MAQNAPIKIWDGISGYLQPEDIALIKRLAGQLPPFPVLVYDLGAGSGTGALSVFTARVHNITVVSVDISQEALNATRANMEQFGFIKHWSGVKCRSDKAPETVGLLEGSVNMLLCDSTHDYASQQDELNTWFKYLAPGAFVWVHEYAGYANSIYPGVRVAIDEFISAGKLKSIAVQGYSWGGVYTNGLA